MNTADSERVATVLSGMGGQSTDNLNHADVVVLNTCSVRQSAENRAVGFLRRVEEIKKQRPEVVSIVTGCMASKQGLTNQQKADIGQMKKKLPATDILLDIQELGELPQRLQPLLSDAVASTPPKPGSYLDIKPNTGKRHTAYVPISTGCNNFCTFCIVPYTRGREVSRDVQSILDECRQHIASGTKDLVLLGQNVDSYGKDLGVSFSDLLTQVNNLDGDFWVHFTTNNPQDMTTDVIAAVRDLEKLQPYFHLPIQAGSEEILRRMARKHTLREYYDLYEMIRTEVPGVSITTDIIVGFPGETEHDFEQTVRVFEDLRYDMAYLNRYSPRSPAPSSRMTDDVPGPEKQRREHVLNDILQQTALERNMALVGTTTRCIVKEYSGKHGHYVATTPQLKTITFSAPKDAYVDADWVSLRVTDATSWRLSGEVVA